MQPDYKTESNMSRCFFYVTILLLAFIYYLSYIRHSFIQTDEGLILDPIFRELHGEKWYVDFFAAHGPMYHVPIVYLSKVIGLSFMGYRIYFVFVRLIALGLLLSISQRMVPKSWSVGVVLPAIIAPSVMLKTPMMLMQVLTAWLVFRFWESKNKLWVFWLGVFSAFTFWIRVETIFPATIISLVGLALERPGKGILLRQKIAIFLVGFVICHVLLILLFPGIKTIFPFWMRFAFGGKIPTLGIAFPTLSLLTGPDRDIGRFLLVWLVVISYFLVFVALLKNAVNRNFSEETKKLAIIWLSGVLFSYSAFYQSNVSHFLQVGAPAYLLGGYIFYNLTKHCNSWAKKTLTRAIAITISLTFSVYVLLPGKVHETWSITARKIYKAPIYSWLGTVFYLPDKAQEIQEVIDYIQKNTNTHDYVVSIPEIMLIAVMANRRNSCMASPLYPRIDKIVGKENEKKLYEGVLKAELIVYFERATRLEVFRPKNQRFHVYLPVLYNLIVENYTFEKRIGDYIILRRGKDGSGATSAFMEGWEEYKYGSKEVARAYFEKAIAQGGPHEEIMPLLTERK